MVIQSLKHYAQMQPAMITPHLPPGEHGQSLQTRSTAPRSAQDQCQRLVECIAEPLLPPHLNCPRLARLAQHNTCAPLRLLASRTALKGIAIAAAVAASNRGGELGTPAHMNALEHAAAHTKSSPSLGENAQQGSRAHACEASHPEEEQAEAVAALVAAAVGKHSAVLPRTAPAAEHAAETAVALDDAAVRTKAAAAMEAVPEAVEPLTEAAPQALKAAAAAAAVPDAAEAEAAAPKALTLEASPLNDDEVTREQQQGSKAQPQQGDGQNQGSKPHGSNLPSLDGDKLQPAHEDMGKRERGGRGGRVAARAEEELPPGMVPLDVFIGVFVFVFVFVFVCVSDCVHACLYLLSAWLEWSHMQPLSSAAAEVCGHCAFSLFLCPETSLLPAATWCCRRPAANCPGD
jgi:hypothetical protein